MKKTLMILVSFLLALSWSATMTGCHENDRDGIVDDEGGDGADPLTYYDITMLYIPNGVGDRSYTDQIFKSASLVEDFMREESEADGNMRFMVHHLVPSSQAQAEQFIAEWDHEVGSANLYRLLVLTSNIYTDAIQKNSNWRKAQNTDVLMLDAYLDDPDLYTISMNLYGPAWCSGYLRGINDDKSAAILVANTEDQTLKDAVNGWLDGYRASGADADTIQVFPIGGYADETRASQLTDSIVLTLGINHIVCFAGASQMGVLRSCKKYGSMGYYDTPNVTICENTFQDTWDYYLFAALKKEMGSAMSFWILNWWEDKTMKRHIQYTLRSTFESTGYRCDYLGIRINPYNCSVSEEQIDEIQILAEEAEKKYLGI